MTILNTKKYTLFLDEIQANDPLQYFCLAGVIIENEKYSDLVDEINQIKIKHFGTTDVVFHEVDIRNAKKLRVKTPNHRIIKRKMKDLDKRKSYFEDIVHFFNSNDFSVLSASLHQENAKNSYPKHRDKYFMALQILLENFTHFLIENEGIGDVIIESRRSQNDTSLDDQLDMHFNKLRCLTGTLFYNAECISKYIKTISFEDKTQNNIGLQLADMIPNPLNRHLSGVEQAIENMYQTIENKIYDGNRSNIKRFGQKVLVKTFEKPLVEVEQQIAVIDQTQIEQIS